MKYPVRTRRWSRAEYDRMIDIGVLDEDERIELLGASWSFANLRAAPITRPSG